MFCAVHMVHISERCAPIPEKTIGCCQRFGLFVEKISAYFSFLMRVLTSARHQPRSLKCNCPSILNKSSSAHKKSNTQKHVNTRIFEQHHEATHDSHDDDCTVDHPPPFDQYKRCKNWSSGTSHAISDVMLSRSSKSEDRLNNGRANPNV